MLGRTLYHRLDAPGYNTGRIYTVEHVYHGYIKYQAVNYIHTVQVKFIRSTSIQKWIARLTHNSHYTCSHSITAHFKRELKQLKENTTEVSF